jgi:hypothetical protein
MNMNRRDFVGGAVATAALPSLPGSGSGPVVEPVRVVLLGSPTTGHYRVEEAAEAARLVATGDWRPLRAVRVFHRVFDDRQPPIVTGRTLEFEDGSLVTIGWS